MSKKLNKDSVSYTPRTENWAERCAVCDHWDGGGVCAVVQGPIAEAGWCVNWRPRPAAPVHVVQPKVLSGGEAA